MAETVSDLEKVIAQGRKLLSKCADSVLKTKPVREHAEYYRRAENWLWQHAETLFTAASALERTEQRLAEADAVIASLFPGSGAVAPHQALNTAHATQALDRHEARARHPTPGTKERK